MTHAWTHAWCKSPARDEAVRAAEDGRTEPLPTLGECIVAPFADAAERSSTVSKTGEGQSGMRTERVTLEVTHGAALSAREWRMWRTIFDPRYGESVRVVEEELSDAWAQRLARLTEERDAAIRERDQIRENARADHNIAKAACDERDAAIRERESWKLLADRTNERLSAAEARVAELKKRSSFLSQHKEAYAYETMLDGWEIGSREWAEAEPELHWIKLTAPENDAAGGGLEVKPAASGSGEGEPYMVTASGIPLYRAPPPPRGWLTEEERDLIAWIVDEDAYTEKAQSIAKGLLARSTPPEVVKPSRSMYTVSSPYAHGWDECDRAYRSAIAAAGVAVKE